MFALQNTFTDVPRLPPLWHPRRKQVTTLSDGLPFEFKRGSGVEKEVFDYAFAHARIKSIETAVLFRGLCEEWYSAMKFVAGGDERFMHPAYQRIIGLGPDVIPLVIKEVQGGRGSWNWALKALTGANPIGKDSKGRPRKIAEDWVRWAKENNYLVHD